MTFVSIGDLAQSYWLSRQTAETKSRLTELSQELSSGLTTDTGKRVSGDFGPLSDIESRLTLLNRFQSTDAELETAMDVMQLSLDQVGDVAETLSSGLLLASNSPQPALLNSTGTDARNSLGQVISALNVSVAGRHLFSGVATDGPPLVDADQLMTDLEAAVAGLTEVQDVIDAVDAWFDTPGGSFETMAYIGAAQDAGPQRLSNGSTASLSLRADDPALRNTVKHLAMAAMLDSGSVLSADADGRAALAGRAAEGLLSAQSAVAEAAARVGSVQNQISSVRAANTAEIAVLEIARTDLLSADPYETATRLEATQTQLETLYTITARLARLNLTDFLQ